MVQKIRDIAVKTAEYTDRDGNTKGRWQNVGALMKGDDGNEFILLERWFNPAGIADPQNRGSVLLSCFPIKDRDGQPQQRQQTQRPAQQHAPAAGRSQDFDDDIPF